MPQWSRDWSGDAAKYPDERWRASCPGELVPILRRYDHHVVRVAGRPALLRTFHWSVEEPDDASDTFSFEISFTYAPGHPNAPAEVQAIVDSLSFSPVETTT